MVKINDNFSTFNIAVSTFSSYHMQYTNIVFACSLMNWCKSVCKKLMSQNQLLSVMQIVSESVMATNSCQLSRATTGPLLSCIKLFSLTVIFRPISYQIWVPAHRSSLMMNVMTCSCCCRNLSQTWELT